MCNILEKNVILMLFIMRHLAGRGKQVIHLNCNESI